MSAISRPLSRVVHQVSIATCTLSESQSINLWKLSRRVCRSTFQATHLSSNPTSNLRTSPQIRPLSFKQHLLSSSTPLSFNRSYTSQKPNHIDQTKSSSAKMAPTTDLDYLPKERQPIVISGPSGSGKSTMLTMLFEKYPGRFGFSVSREFLVLFSSCGGGEANRFGSHLGCWDQGGVAFWRAFGGLLKQRELKQPERIVSQS